MQHARSLTYRRMREPDINLTPSEQKLFGDIDFDWSRRDDYEAFQKNGGTVVALMKSLFANKTIPEVRLKYFTDPRYQVGRLKGSHRDLFHRNGNTDDEMMRHAHFLPFLHYFVCGPDLPVEAIVDFGKKLQVVVRYPPAT